MTGSKEYLSLLCKALDILGIKISAKKKEPEQILKILKDFSKGPVMSQSDISVHDQVRELVKAVESKKPLEEVENLLNKLAEETDYRDYWD
jgi:uncharacterized membrane protein YjjP (DUF1212 family)